MIIGLLEVNISIPDARSLKDKRMVIRSLKDRVTNKMNVSAAEVGKQDIWKSAELAFVTVAAEKKIAEKRLSDLQRYLGSDPRYVLLTMNTHYM